MPILRKHHCIYELDYEKRQFNHLALDDMAREIGTVVIERYEALLSNEGVEDEDDGGQLPFIRFLLNNAALMPDSPIVKMEQFVAGMTGLGVTAQLRGISQQMRKSSLLRILLKAFPKIPVARLSGSSYKKQVCATSILLKYIKLYDCVRRDIDHRLPVPCIIS